MSDPRECDEKQKMNYVCMSESDLHDTVHPHLNTLLRVCWKYWATRIDQEEWHPYGVLWD